MEHVNDVEFMQRITLDQLYNRLMEKHSFWLGLRSETYFSYEWTVF